MVLHHFAENHRKIDCRLYFWNLYLHLVMEILRKVFFGTVCVVTIAWKCLWAELFDVLPATVVFAAAVTCIPTIEQRPASTFFKIWTGTDLVVRAAAIPWISMIELRLSETHFSLWKSICPQTCWRTPKSACRGPFDFVSV